MTNIDNIPMRNILILSVCVMLIIAWWFMPSSQVIESHRSNTLPEAMPHQVENQPTESSKSLANDKIDWQKTSLKGTDIDGMYPVDSDGNLLFSAAIKHRFEYFLSTMGEFPLDDVLQMVRGDIEANLTSPAKEQALKLFDDYIAYKYALVELEKTFEPSQHYEVSNIERFRHQLEQLRNKRREHLDSEAADAFFGFDELYDDFMLSQLEIQNNSQLTPSEKQQQIQALQQGLPEDVRQMREETERISKVFELTQEMKEEGASESQVFDYNSQQFGQEAAQRLQALDENRQAWQQKVDNYLLEKSQILKDDLLSHEEQIQEIKRLANERFTSLELKRLPAFEVMAQDSESK